MGNDSKERWIKITVDDIASYQAGALVKNLQNAAKNETQSDPVAAAIKEQVLFVRSQIASGDFALDRDFEKIPRELKSYAIALIVEFAKNRLPSLTPSDTEKTLAAAARAHLKEIAEKKIRPSTPDDPEPSNISTQTSGGAALVRPGKNAPKRTDYSGL